MPRLEPSGPRPSRIARSLRVLGRVYERADRDLKAGLLACLVRPLGVLGLAGVAGGAFAGLLRTNGDGAMRVVIEDAAFDHEQIAELASFAAQVDPQSLLDAARLLTPGPVVAVAGASLAFFFVRELRRSGLMPRRAG